MNSLGLFKITDQDSHLNPLNNESNLNIFWDAIVGAAADVLKNQPKDQLATKIPISGVYTNSRMDLISTIGSLLRNAFIRALIPKFDRKITTGEAAKKVQQGQIPNATTNGPPANTNRDLCKTDIPSGVASGLWPERLEFPTNLSRHSPDATCFAEVSNQIEIKTPPSPKKRRERRC